MEYPSVSFWAMRSISLVRVSSSSLLPSLLHSLLVLRGTGPWDHQEMFPTKPGLILGSSGHPAPWVSASPRVGRDEGLVLTSPMATSSPPCLTARLETVGKRVFCTLGKSCPHPGSQTGLSLCPTGVRGPGVSPHAQLQGLGKMGRGSSGVSLVFSGSPSEMRPGETIQP